MATQLGLVSLRKEEEKQRKYNMNFKKLYSQKIQEMLYAQVRRFGAEAESLHSN